MQQLVRAARQQNGAGARTIGKIGGRQGVGAYGVRLSGPGRRGRDVADVRREQRSVQTAQQRAPEVRGQPQTGQVKTAATARGQGRGCAGRNLAPVRGQRTAGGGGLRGARFQIFLGDCGLQPEHGGSVAHKGQILRPARPQAQQQHGRPLAPAFPGLRAVRQMHVHARVVGQTDTARG